MKFPLSPISLKSLRAFTLTEIMLCVALIALASAALLPSFGGMISSQREREAKDKAALINMAKASYVREIGQAAFTTWVNTPADDDRFMLIKEQLGPGCTAASLSAFSPIGFSFVIQDLDQPVTIADPDGHAVTY